MHVYVVSNVFTFSSSHGAFSAIRHASVTTEEEFSFNESSVAKSMCNIVEGRSEVVSCQDEGNYIRNPPLRFQARITTSASHHHRNRSGGMRM